MSKLRMSGDIPLLHLHAFNMWEWKALSLQLTISSVPFLQQQLHQLWQNNQTIPTANIWLVLGNQQNIDIWLVLGDQQNIDIWLVLCNQQNIDKWLVLGNQQNIDIWLVLGNQQKTGITEFWESSRHNNSPPPCGKNLFFWWNDGYDCFLSQATHLN